MKFGIFNDEECACHLLSQSTRDRGTVCIGCHRRKARERNAARIRVSHLGANPLANWYTGPIIVLAVFAVGKVITRSQIEQTELLGLILLFILWLRWTAEREFHYLRELVEQMSAELQRLDGGSDRPSRES